MKIVILGAGESGIGAALLAKKIGAEVWVSDGGTIKEKYKTTLVEHQLPFEEGKHSIEKFFDADVIIKSPGIPPTAEVVQTLREAGKSIISEIEFAYRHAKGSIIAITGSNGKTTTTALIYHLLNEAGKSVAVGGNIGKSFARILAEETQPSDLYVLEVSSFQLDDIQDFKPDVAVLVNITADHLDRYQWDMAKYAAAKFRIAMNQAPSDAFVYCVDDPVTMGEIWKHEPKAERLGFSLEQKPGSLIWMEKQEIVAGYKFRVDYRDMQLKGKHNAFNVMAAILVAKRLGVTDEAVRAALPSFGAIEHRMEPVATIDGVLYINDSKATNVDSTFYALKSMETPTVWIAGGLDKGNEYGILDISKVKALVILGPNKDKLLEAFSGKIETIGLAEDMPAAIKLSQQLAEPGDTVLLAPACSSFDIFENFEARGRIFKEEVEKLKSK